MIRHALLAPLLLLLPTAGAAQRFDDSCEHQAERTASVAASASNPLRLSAGAGSLRVEGRPGLQEVRVRGTACASSARLLEQIQVVAERAGTEVRVETRMPESRGMEGSYARLDLVIEVPEGIALDAEDSSGETVIRNVGALRLDDSSGAIELEAIVGDAWIEDSSGGIHVRDVRGNVRVSDTSGDLEVHSIQGAVVVERDGSGDIRISEVTRDVRIERDSSGGIDVSNVRGGLSVERDGSGGIRYRDVAGPVSVPSRRR